MNIKNLITELDKTIENARMLPMTNKCVVEKNLVITILNEMRLELPDEIKEAHRILSDKERIISNAKREAQSILKEADIKAKLMVEQSEITRKAENLANSMMDKAETYDSQTRRAVNEYADSILADLQKTITGVMDTINITYNETMRKFKSTLDEGLVPVDTNLNQLLDTIIDNRNSLDAGYTEENEPNE